MLDSYLVETLSSQLQAWLYTPYYHEYADNMCREIPLNSKSLVVYPKFVEQS